MTFLENIDPLARLQIQFNAFLKTENLCFLSTMTDVVSFDVPFKQFSKEQLSNLKFEKKLRLGNRLEQFLAFALEENEKFEVLAENIQVVENKITIGEIDFIIQNKNSQEVFHLELANKFYLYDSSIINEIDRWVGPNRNDSLIQKVNKLNTKQFPLLNHPQTKLALKELKINSEKVEQKILFKTQLFFPLSLYFGVNSNKNIAGFFISETTFLSDEYKQLDYFIPEKQDWQIDAKYCQKWFSHAEVLPNIRMYLKEKKSPLVWLKKPNGTFDKFFIVWW